MNNKEYAKGNAAVKRSGISRRSFLAGTALTAAGAAVTTMLGGCSPESSDSASTNGTAAAGGSDLAPSPAGTTYPWPANPPEIADEDVEEEIDTDVAVIGLGVSGVAAFRAAAEAGAKVVGFEKCSTISVRSSQYAYFNGKLTSLYDNLAEFDLDEIAEEEFNACSRMSNYAIVRKWLYNCADAFDWWVAGDEECYVPSTAEEANTRQMPGEGEEHAASLVAMNSASIDWQNENQASYPMCLSITGHEHVVAANLEKGIAAGGSDYYGHFAEKLIMEDGRCTGVYVRNSETGKYKKVNASKGVILSCGDCASNPDMMGYFFPEVVENGNGNSWPNMDVEGTRSNTGDVFKLGYWAGAGIAQSQAPMIHVMGGPGDTDSQEDSVGLTAPLLRINYNGERFMNEDTSATDCEFAFDKQPQHKAFVIFDSHLDEQSPDFIVVAPSATTLADFDERAGDGVVFKGETLEELFSSIEGMDVDTAIATVKRYNELCENGYDDDYGKKAKYMLPVQDGPFYAQRMGVGLCLCTMGGLSSDENAHVISTERKVIPGLYVSGNAQGDRFAVKYPFNLSGSSHSMAMYYGKVAGENAAMSA